MSECKAIVNIPLQTPSNAISFTVAEKERETHPFRDLETTKADRFPKIIRIVVSKKRFKRSSELPAKALPIPRATEILPAAADKASLPIEAPGKCFARRGALLRRKAPKGMAM